MHKKDNLENSKVSIMGNALAIKLYKEFEEVKARKTGGQATPIDAFGLYKKKDWGDGVTTSVDVDRPKYVNLVFPLKMAQRALVKKIKLISNYYDCLEIEYEIKGSKCIPITLANKKRHLYYSETALGDHIQRRNRIIKHVYCSYLSGGSNKKNALKQTQKLVKFNFAVFGNIRFKKRDLSLSTEAIRKIVSQ